MVVQLLRWILGKVKQRGGEVDSNKQYTSELLAILMQHSEKNQTRLGDANGIDTILQAIAYYKNRCGQ
jgi:beta-catenin-like protein 1